MKREKQKQWPKRIPTWRDVWHSALRGMPKWAIKYGGRPRPRYYEAVGGPFHGRTLTLVDGTTAPLRVGNVRGKYRCGIVATGNGIGTTKWIAS